MASKAVERLEIGVIGAGRIGKVHLGNVVSRMPDVHVRWVCDSRIDTDATMRSAVETLVDPSPLCRITSDFRDVVSDSSVRAVLVTTSTNAHLEVVLAALSAGKDVFCEKPVAMSTDDTRVVLEAARKSGRIFQVGFNRRFDHNMAKVCATVASGAVGKPTVVHVFSRDPTYDINYIRRSVTEGGIFIDMMIHDFDMVQFLAGTEDPIVEVFAWGSSIVAPEIGELGDVATAVVMLKTKSGVMCTIDNTRKTGYGYDQRVEVLGTKGSVSCDNDRPTTVRTMIEGGNTEEDRILWWFMDRYPEAFVSELREFFKLVRAGGGKPPVDCEDMLRAMFVARAACESLKTGLPVRVTQI